ncbi:MAG: carbonic anhydrase, partial [Bdellovibrio sp.]
MLRIFTLCVLVLSAACSTPPHERNPNQDFNVVLKDARGSAKEAPPATSQMASADAETNAHHQAAEVKEAVAAAAQHIETTHGKHDRELGP